MIVPASGVKVLIAMQPVDFRKGMDGLAALVRETLGANPYGGVIYVFRSRRADRVKLLFWDGTGLVLASKRLEEGSFRWPTLREGVMRLTPGAAFGALGRPRLGAGAWGANARAEGSSLTANKLANTIFCWRLRGSNMIHSCHGGHC